MPRWSVKPWIGKTVELQLVSGKSITGELVEPGTDDGWLVVRVPGAENAELAYRLTAIAGMSLKQEASLFVW